MKIENWTKLDDALRDAYSNIKNAYVNSGANENIENDDLIRNWNDNLNTALRLIRELQEEMIFTLKIED